MRSCPLPRVGRSAIRQMPAHVLVRDYPETLALLLERDVNLDRAGTCRVGDFAVPELIREIEEAIAWRPAARSSSS